jgi:ADP-ribosylglycohydrolase
VPIEDSAGAMGSALAGALHGSSWIPARWYDNIENGEHGRDEMVELGWRLSKLDGGVT